jgi:hypothetical protein
LDVGQPGSSVKRFAFALYTLAVFIIVASYFLVHLMGFGFFFFTAEGLAFGARCFSFPVLIFFVLGFDTPFVLRVDVVFSAMWIVYVVCFVAAWGWRRSFHAVLGKAVSDVRRRVFDNFLFAMPLLSSLALTAALAIIFAQSAVGVKTGEVQLPSNVHEAFLNVAYAPLIEELAFRLMPIGLLVILIVFLSGRNLKAWSGFGRRFRLFFLAFLYPEGAKKAAGLPTVGEHGLLRGVSVPEWVAIVGTSAFFGLAHVFSPIGWEVGKFTSAFVQGVFFAATYVAYGFEAPVLLHWYFNYYNYFFILDVAGNFFPAAIDLLSVIEFLTLVLGIVGWSLFAMEGVRRLLQRQRRKHSQPPLPPVTST